ncbi:hypothetical protein LTR41_003836 [Exophiala xenobiotica]|nr:hypothetical protein LTR41_003836 [Exophiala xenobiotica]KAK5279874.1 hypothetical protein LTR40_007163 [Exophiala xenobiotica]KAK5387121.1 hypothetical protein LTR11_000786 [Exophiala xenobiotica]
MASTPSMCVLARLRTKIRQTEGFITDLEQARPLREIARSCGLSSNIVTHRIAVYNKRMTEIAFVMLNSDDGAGAGVSIPIRRTFTRAQTHDVFVDAMVKNMMGLSMKEALREAATEEIERVDTEEDSLFRMFGIWPARVRRIELYTKHRILRHQNSFDTLLFDPSGYPVETTKPAFLKRFNSETFKSVAAYSEFCNAGSTLRLTHQKQFKPSTLFLLKIFDQVLDTIGYLHHSGVGHGDTHMGNLLLYVPDENALLPKKRSTQDFTISIKGMMERRWTYAAHMAVVKNSDSQVHLAVAKLFAPKVWIQSGTPALNAPVDLTGYLALWWRDEYNDDIDNCELPEDERMYTDATWAKVQKKCPDYAEKHRELLYTLNY